MEDRGARSGGGSGERDPFPPLPRPSLPCPRGIGRIVSRPCCKFWFQFHRGDGAGLDEDEEGGILKARTRAPHSPPPLCSREALNPDS